jgi:hypothetical protein
MIIVMNNIPEIEGTPELTTKAVQAKVLGDVAIELEDRINAIEMDGEAVVELFNDNGSVGVRVDCTDDKLNEAIKNALNIQ